MPKKGQDAKKKKDAGSKGPPDPAAEFQQRQRMQLQLRLRFHELYDEEQAMSAWSQREIRMRWLDWLRSEKYATLGKEIEIVAHAHEKALDRKNAILAMLVRDLSETEEQYNLALRTHLRNVDTLIDTQQRRASDLHHVFETQLLELRQEYELERENIVERHERERAHLQRVVENMQAEAEAMEKHMEVNFATQREETSEKSSDELHMLTTQLEFEIRDLQREIQLKNEEYQNKAGDKMKTYQDKSKKDKKQAESITVMMRRISKLQEQIKNTKANGNNNIKECEERNEAMRRERDTIAQHFKNLKAHMQQWRRVQEKKLSALVSMANHAKEALKTRAEQAERILALDQLCRELETERERYLGAENDITVREIQREVQQRKEASIDGTVLPLGNRDTAGAAHDGAGTSPYLSNAPASYYENNSDGRQLTQAFSGDDDGTGEMMNALTEEERVMLCMRAFWKRYNKVVVDNAAVAQERFHLTNENTKLKQLLKQYLDGITVSHNVMSENHNNNLLHITAFGAANTGPLHHGRPISNRMEGVPMLETTPTVIEGVSVIRDLVRQRC